jgi:predicted O-methyltransferase YrrM
MILDTNKIQKINMDEISSYLSHSQAELSRQGEPYKFYAYISTLVNNKTILDVGTRDGLSALAFSYNPNNKIISYDLVEQGASNIKKENLQFKIMDFRSDESLNYKDIAIIMIDVDPHDGIKELEMIEYLKDKNWKGILILDDILNNWPAMLPGANPAAMNNFWNNLQETKHNLSMFAHYSGTGLVNLGNKYKIEVK